MLQVSSNTLQQEKKFKYLGTVAILESKKWEATAGPRKSRGANINVYLAW